MLTWRYSLERSWYEALGRKPWNRWQENPIRCALCGTREVDFDLNFWDALPLFTIFDRKVHERGSDNVFKHVCKRHSKTLGETHIDCITGETVQLLPEATKLQLFWQEFRYWCIVAWRFPRYLASDISYAFVYLIHRSTKRWLER